MGCLYRLDFASGKQYIGITAGRSTATRFRQHRSKLSRGSDNAIYCAWRKHGEPRARLLAFASGDYLLDLERRAIAAYGTLAPQGYNLTIGGEHPPLEPATRAKISAAHVGMKHTVEARAKMSVAKSGSKPNVSAQLRARRSTAMLGNRLAAGYKPTPEKLAKMSALMKGNQYGRLAKQTEEETIGGPVGT
jgi:hypothetical protein